MKIGVLGTGMVGKTIAGKLGALGHSVIVGTRNVKETLAKTGADQYGAPAISVWIKSTQNVHVGSFAEAAKDGEVIINCTNGMGTLQALKEAGEANLAEKILMDISNPLDFSKGFPPSLFVCNTDSLGEQIQKAFPRTKVVKTLNTVTAPLMVNPLAVGDGDHSVFVSGNDADAKSKVTEYLKSWFGWKDVVDLGDITTARGVEAYLLLWVRLYGAFQSPLYNLRIVK